MLCNDNVKMNVSLFSLNHLNCVYFTKHLLYNEETTTGTFYKHVVQPKKWKKYICPRHTVKLVVS